jgi:hypothetical protein
MAKINVNGTDITIISIAERDYISPTDMIGNWEGMYNPLFNSPEFEGIKQSERLIKPNQIAMQQMQVLREVENRKFLS